MVTSRVGRKPVVVPTGVDVKLQDNNLLIKGPKGQATMSVHRYVDLEIQDGHIHVKQSTQNHYTQPGVGAKLSKSIAGTVRANIDNLVSGVSNGFEKKLLLVGVGYRAQMKGSVLNLSIGYSHPVNFTVPKGITIETPSQTEILVKGIDKHLVGHTASMIRDIRSPEPYKGKGIRYANEVIILKETKKK